MANVVYQPLIKLKGRLKDKSSKITYIHNKQLRDTLKQNDLKHDVKEIKYVGILKIQVYL